MANSITYELNFSGLDNVLKAINKSSNTLGDKLNEEIKKTKQNLNKVLDDVKFNPSLQTSEVKAKIAQIKTAMQKATKAKVRLDKKI